MQKTSETKKALKRKIAKFFLGLKPKVATINNKPLLTRVSA